MRLSQSGSQFFDKAIPVHSILINFGKDTEGKLTNSTVSIHKQASIECEVL